MASSQIISLPATVTHWPLWACVVGIVAISLGGCEPRRDPYAEHLLEQRNKALQQLERKAQSDKSFDLLCWDITPHIQRPQSVKQWATSHRGLDVIALAGPDYANLKQAADMAEVVNSLDRGWPVVTGTNEIKDKPLEQYYVMNANGYRFDGVITDPIKDWNSPSDGSERLDPPTIIQLQVRYTPFELVLVYMTNSSTVSDRQWAALSRWIEKQTAPVIVFGQFDTSRLPATAGLVSIDPERLAISKSIEDWQFSIEELTSPLGDVSRPYMIRCQQMVAKSASPTPSP